MEKLDDIDLEILRILQQDAKKTTREIAESLHLTASPVYERIKRLEKTGYIEKYVALLDKKRLNQSITAICMVSLRYHNKGFIDTFERQIKEVQECYHMAGKVDFFLKIHLESLEQYHEFVRSKLSNIENIGVLESYFVLKEITKTTTYHI
ncbi:Lrp/AsnC family transcriptional regulator [Flavobacteriaceae bacterium F89]|uniref:Lrp/AsnC family transcriptional regulator n=1 Tax=Cerina litoralis TaxID=2874477 RepID=A0AAE3EXW9_9FLAO|nr:Lrp/AsnC family transcriptional regulator [Cerina litoralis]MCG2462288.1 Lrp/AsnC family transcriptional regulator [Cerina litoralis]